jgi:hypothetical protein
MWIPDPRWESPELLTPLAPPKSRCVPVGVSNYVGWNFAMPGLYLPGAKPVDLFPYSDGGVSSEGGRVEVTSNIEIDNDHEFWRPQWDRLLVVLDIVLDCFGFGLQYAIRNSGSASSNGFVFGFRGNGEIEINFGSTTNLINDDLFSQSSRRERIVTALSYDGSTARAVAKNFNSSVELYESWVSGPAAAHSSPIHAEIGSADPDIVFRYNSIFVARDCPAWAASESGMRHLVNHPYHFLIPA